jgi:hypothetical protein
VWLWLGRYLRPWASRPRPAWAGCFTPRHRAQRGARGPMCAPSPCAMTHVTSARPRRLSVSASQVRHASSPAPGGAPAGPVVTYLLPCINLVHKGPRSRRFPGVPGLACLLRLLSVWPNRDARNTNLRQRGTPQLQPWNGIALPSGRTSCTSRAAEGLDRSWTTGSAPSVNCRMVRGGRSGPDSDVVVRTSGRRPAHCRRERPGSRPRPGRARRA